jgi:hypothetical protein
MHTARTLIMVVLLCGTVYASENKTQVEWISLFDGKTLNGWQQLGGGKWTVEDGTILGETGDGRYGWLMTTQQFTDFILELKLRCEGPGNSGIQFRSHWINGNMYGYQGEVDPPPEDDTGGVYEEKGRGWLHQPDPETKKKVVLEGWNTYRISMIGTRITTIVNGVTVSDFDDDRTVRGGIALQVHSGKTPVRIRWKDIRIQDLGYGKGWKPLFNGKDLTGWVIHGKERWDVENGCIVGESTASGYGYLATEREDFKDFSVRACFKTMGRGNSGLFFHCRLDGTEIRGIQAEVDPTPGNHTGGLYESGRRGWLVLPSDLAEMVMNPDDWNEIQVTCVGNRILTHVNGYRAVDYMNETPMFQEGPLALQIHSGGGVKLLWKDIYVR